MVDQTQTPVGTTELKAVLALVVDTVNVGVQALKDGKVSLSDLPLLVNLVPELVPAVSGLSKVPAELKDLTEDEAIDVTTFVMGKLAVDSAKAQAVVAASLKLLVGVVGVVEALKA